MGWRWRRRESNPSPDLPDQDVYVRIRLGTGVAGLPAALASPGPYFDDSRPCLQRVNEGRQDYPCETSLIGAHGCCSPKEARSDCRALVVPARRSRGGDHLVAVVVVGN